MNRRTVFCIENRNDGYMYHWFMFMMTGLRHINLNTVRTSVNCFWAKNNNALNMHVGKEKNIELYNPVEVKKPYYIFFKKIDKFTDYQQQTFELIKDEYIILKESEITDDDIVVYNYGEPITHTPFVISPDAYYFLKKLLSSKIDFDNKYKNKKYFLSRSKSHYTKGNTSDEVVVKRRQILNETDLTSKLNEFGIETIFLEDYDVIEKIKIFRNASLIISPNSASLTFSMFSTGKTKIVELNIADPSQICTQYEEICKIFNIPYYKFYTEKVEDKNDGKILMIDNMIVDVLNFTYFLENIDNSLKRNLFLNKIKKYLY